VKAFVLGASVAMFFFLKSRLNAASGAFSRLEDYSSEVFKEQEEKIRDKIQLKDKSNEIHSYIETDICT